jgi:hypothetical protein
MLALASTVSMPEGRSPSLSSAPSQPPTMKKRS